MSLSSHSHFLTGGATVADIQQLVASLTIAKIARPVTVKIDNLCGSSGSGVIINKQETIYTVLTANRVVESTDVEYTIHTHTGKQYAITEVIRFQQWANQPDIALIQFDSSDAYPVASLGNSDDARIGTAIYIAGYPRTAGGERPEFDFTNGIIINRLNGRLLGYNAPAWSGMTGAPVFNTDGQVIGIHVGREVNQESGTVLQIAVALNLSRCRQLLENAIAFSP